MRRAVSITLAVLLAGNPAFAAPDNNAQKKLTAAVKNPSRLVPKPEAPPRVLDGILGFLKTTKIDLGASGVSSGADGKSGDSASTGSTGSSGSASGAGLPNPFAGTGSGSSGKPTGSASTKPAAGTGQGDDGKAEIEENNNSPVADKANANANKPGGGGAPPEKKLKKLSTVFPVCIFIDESTQSKANAAIKGMVDMGAECDVQILAFPVVTNFPSPNYQVINDAQVAACNIPPELGTEGKGSATSFVKWETTAAEMCNVPDKDDPTGWDRNVAGCAQVRAARGADGIPEAEAKAKSDPEFAKNFAEQRKDFGGRMKGGNVVPSIEVPKGHDAVVLSHEALGHSQMGRPNGKTMGNGIGEWGEKPSADKSGGDGGWTKPQGCAALKANAFPNEKNYLYDAERQTYFTPQSLRVYQLGSDPPIFSTKNSPPLAGPAGGPTPPGTGFPEGSPGSSKPLGGEEALVTRTPAKNDAKPGATTAIADSNLLTAPKPAGRHETKSGGGVTLSELRQKNPPKDDARDDSFAVVSQKPSGGAPNVFGSSGSRESVRIDESASLTTGVSTVSSGGKTSGSPVGTLYNTSTGGGGGGGGGGSGGSRVVIDESMTANGPTAKVESGSPPKLFLGKGAPPSTKPSGFESALSNDFFSNVKFDEVEKERRRQPSSAKRGIASEDGGGGRRSDSGGEVRSLRR